MPQEPRRKRPVRPVISKAVKLTQGKERTTRAISLLAFRHFKKLGTWYDAEVAKGKLTPAQATIGQIEETSVFVLKKLGLPQEKQSKAVTILTADGKNQQLMVLAQVRVPYLKKDFIANIDAALEVLPLVQEELVKVVPHGSKIVTGLPSVREQLLRSAQTSGVGGFGIMGDISLIHFLRLKQVLGEETFHTLSEIQTNLMKELQKKH